MSVQALFILLGITCLGTSANENCTNQKWDVSPWIGIRVVLDNQEFDSEANLYNAYVQLQGLTNDINTEINATFLDCMEELKYSLDDGEKVIAEARPTTFSFSKTTLHNVERCVRYRIRVIATMKGGSPSTLQVVVDEIYLPADPTLEVKPKLLATKLTSAKVEVNGGDTACLDNVNQPVYAYTCNGGMEAKSRGHVFVIDQLLPGTRYSCYVRVEYPYQDTTSPNAQFSFITENLSPNDFNIIPDKTWASVQVSDRLRLLNHVSLRVKTIKVFNSEKEVSEATTIMEGLRPFTTYQFCLSMKLLRCIRPNNAETSCEFSPCKTETTKEDCPGDVPRISNAVAREDIITAQIYPPQQPNGVIKAYHLEVDSKCPFWDQACDKCDDFIPFQKLSQASAGSNQVTTLHLSLLSPNTVYQIKVKAMNSVCNSSTSEPLQITTRPTFKGFDQTQFQLSNSSGDSYVSVTPKPLCPFMGSLEYSFSLSQIRKSSRQPRLIESKQAIYDPQMNINNQFPVQFNGLENGYHYQVCITTVRIRSKWCMIDCALHNVLCQTVETYCAPLPPPTLPLKQVSWQPGADFNPFNSVMVLMEAGTFQGAESGITKFQLHCTEQKISKDFSPTGTVDHAFDSRMVLSNLSPGSSLDIAITAFACKGVTQTTDSISVTTASFEMQIPQWVGEDVEAKLQEAGVVSLEDDDDGNAKAVFLLLESRLNREHGNIVTYHFGATLIHGYSLESQCLSITDDIGIDISLEPSDSVLPCLLVVRYDKNQPLLFNVTERSYGSAQTHFKIIDKPAYGLNALGPGLGGASVLILFLACGGVGYLWRGKMARKKALESSRPIMMTITNEETNPLIQASNVLTKSELLAKAQDADFCQDEYRRLKDLDMRFIELNLSIEVGRSWSARHAGGKSMNRYGNIIPYDNNRVVLSKPVNDCDYINASWVRGFEDRKWVTDALTMIKPELILRLKRFIACQGPLDHTIPHFWQMVLENKVGLIVMLTKLKEKSGGKRIDKCAKYWPDMTESPMKLEDIQLKIQSSQNRVWNNDQNIKIRKFQLVTTNVLKTKHEVIQLHFKGWPDHGVPQEPSDLLHLHQVLQELEEPLPKAPIVVHCSAGVGRTGTLIGLDTVIRMLEAGAETIDVLNVAYKMREDRTLMIQQSVQYKYLYDCVAEYIRRKEEGSEASNEEDDKKDVSYYYYE